MIKIHRSVDRQWYYTVESRNGKILVTSETMKRRASCYKGIEACKKIFGSKFKVIEIK